MRAYDKSHFPDGQGQLEVYGTSTNWRGPAPGDPLREVKKDKKKRMKKEKKGKGNEIEIYSP